MVFQEGESYDQIFADIERVIMPGVSCTITIHFCSKQKDEICTFYFRAHFYLSGTFKFASSSECKLWEDNLNESVPRKKTGPLHPYPSVPSPHQQTSTMHPSFAPNLPINGTVLIGYTEPIDREIPLFHPLHFNSSIKTHYYMELNIKSTFNCLYFVMPSSTVFLRII
jgi:hypothetical protein